MMEKTRDLKKMKAGNLENLIKLSLQTYVDIAIF